MITHTFYIKKEFLEETKAFIRTIKSARFLYNPYEFSETYQIAVTFDNNDDAHKMDLFLERIKHFDEMTPKKASWFKKLFNLSQKETKVISLGIEDKRKILSEFLDFYTNFQSDGNPYNYSDGVCIDEFIDENWK